MARKGPKIDQQEELDKLAEKLGLPPRDPDACYPCSLCDGILPARELHIIRQEDSRIYICNSCLMAIQKGEIKRQHGATELTKLVKDILGQKVPKGVGDSPPFPPPTDGPFPDPYYPYYYTSGSTAQPKYRSSVHTDPLDGASISIS